MVLRLLFCGLVLNHKRGMPLLRHGKLALTLTHTLSLSLSHRKRVTSFEVPWLLGFFSRALILLHYNSLSL